jgi:hypothetical protein
MANRHEVLNGWSSYIVQRELYLPHFVVPFVKKFAPTQVMYFEGNKVAITAK